MKLETAKSRMRQFMREDLPNHRAALYSEDGVDFGIEIEGREGLTYVYTEEEFAALLSHLVNTPLGQAPRSSTTSRKNIRGIGWELMVEIEQRRRKGDELFDLPEPTTSAIVDLVMGVLARYHAVTLMNDPEMPVPPIPMRLWDERLPRAETQDRPS